MARELLCKECNHHLGEVREAHNPNFYLGCGEPKTIEVAYWSESTQLFGNSMGVRRVICPKCETEHTVYGAYGVSYILRRKRSNTK